MRTLLEDAVGIDEVAAALGRTEDYLRRNWQKLNAEHGFPRKHPTGWTWPRLAVSAWLRAGGMVRPELVPANDVTGFVDVEAAYQAELNRHYGVEA